MSDTTDVIVTNYRTPDDLKRFIESFRLTAPPNTTLTVVDVDPIVPLDWREIPGQLIRMHANNGYAAACNFAATLGHGDIIALFNADIVLKERTIQECSTALRGNPTWGNLGPLQHDSRGLITHAGILGTQESPHQRGWHHRRSEEFSDVRDDAVMVMGSAYFTKRSLWNELTSCPIYRECFPDVNGAFLPTFLYYEETGHSYHSTAHGYKNVYYGKAECVHEWHGSIKTYGDKDSFKESQAIFRTFCDAHGINHD